MKMEVAAYMLNLAAVGIIGFLAGRVQGVKIASVTLMKNIRQIHEDATVHLEALDPEDSDTPGLRHYIQGQIDLTAFMMRTSTKGKSASSSEPSDPESTSTSNSTE